MLSQMVILIGLENNFMENIQLKQAAKEFLKVNKVGPLVRIPMWNDETDFHSILHFMVSFAQHLIDTGLLVKKEYLDFCDSERSRLAGELADILCQSEDFKEQVDVFFRIIESKGINIELLKDKNLYFELFAEHLNHGAMSRTFECALCEREKSVFNRTEGRPNVCGKCSSEEDIQLLKVSYEKLKEQNNKLAMQNNQLMSPKDINENCERAKWLMVNRIFPPEEYGEHPDVCEMYGIIEELQKTVQPSKSQLTDNEIYVQSIKIYPLGCKDGGSLRESWIAGVKWMRDQLNKKS